MKTNQLHDSIIIIFFKQDFADVQKSICLNNDAFFYLFHLLIRNESYFKHFQTYQKCNILRVCVPDSIRGSIDHKSCDIVTKLLWEQIELEDALHWLSTLGGAYSNLGEHSMAFAVKAGQNAFKQMKIALRSEDPLVLCKCWLFVAMSYMQQKRLNEARAIISTVFINVKSGHNDKTLIAMCKGIWARLQYVWNCT